MYAKHYLELPLIKLLMPFKKWGCTALFPFPILKKVVYLSSRGYSHHHQLAGLVHVLKAQGRDSQDIGTRLVKGIVLEPFNTFWLYSARPPSFKHPFQVSLYIP